MHPPDGPLESLHSPEQRPFSAHVPTNCWAAVISTHQRLIAR